MDNESVPNADAKPSHVTNDETPKLPYAPPKLQQYGDIRELTRGSTNNVNPDAAGVSIAITG
jgi:hypothetical protein